MRGWADAGRVGWGSSPTSVPFRVLLVAALLGGVAIAAYRYAAVWTPLQRRYLFAYVRSAVAVTARGEYDLWQVIDRHGTRLAPDEELVSVTTASGETSFALADTAVKAGATRLVWQRRRTSTKRSTPSSAGGSTATRPCSTS